MRTGTRNPDRGTCENELRGSRDGEEEAGQRRRELRAAPYALWPGHEGQCGAEDTPLGYVSFAGEEDAPVDKDTCLAILETVTYPIVFVDTTHTVRYLNKAARRRYYEQRGVPNLEGKSIFDCHQAATKAQMLQLFERMRGGEDEIYLKVNKYNEKVFVVAVRKQDGELLGYYERFECVQ